MDPPPTDSDLPSDPPLKLRLMCSYNGHIIPRPHDKSLCYVGGDTRIVVTDRHTSLNDLTNRLSTTLLNGKSFSLKYQLPAEDLDSLISVTTDEDLENMIEEYDRIVKKKERQTGRMRLFLFTEGKEKRSSAQIENSKTEEWFVNALNGAGRGVDVVETGSVNSLLGLDEVVVDGVLEKKEKEGVGVVGVRRQDVHSVPDSPCLETSSSIGSESGSSFAAGMNLAPIKTHVEEVKGVEEGKVESGGFFAVPAAPVSTAAVVVSAAVADMVSPDSISSESSLTNQFSRQRNMVYQDPALQIHYQNLNQTQSQTQNQTLNQIQTQNQTLNQTQFQNQNQTLNHSTSSNRIATPPTPTPTPTQGDPSYTYPSQFDQQIHQLNASYQQPHYIQPGSQYIPQGAVPAQTYYIVYPPQQQYPSTYISARPTQPYNIQSSYAPSMGSSQNAQQFMAYPPPIHHQSQSIPPSSMSATGNFAYEYADQPKIVYTQPMPPQMAVQYQNAPPVLSEATAQIPNESFKQQNRAAQS